MENTLENKAKFFTQYWRQKVGVLLLPKTKRGFDLYAVGTFKLVDKDDYLQLKPVSAISCDEATEIAVFVGMVNAKAIRVEDEVVIVKDDSYSLVFDKGIITMYCNGKLWHDDTLRIADKVRSMGFLYEFMDLSREEILNRGWAVLKHEG